MLNKPNSTYNKHKPLRYISNNLIQYLLDNNEITWKLMKYDTPDALSKPDLTPEEKKELIYNGWKHNDEGFVLDSIESSGIYRQPWIDDAQTNAQTMLRIYLSRIIPENKVTSVVLYTFEIIVHNKSVHIESNLGDEDNETPVNIENRLELMVQQILETFNGAEVGGIGRIFFDTQGYYETKANIGAYNNRNFFGFRLILGMRING